VERLFKSLLLILFAVILLLSSVLSCSNEDKYGNSGSLHPDTGPEFSIQDKLKNQPEQPITYYAPTPPTVEFQYVQDCYEEQWYFCPPLDAVWQFKMVVDTCTNPPKVISVGECVEKFECDPSNTTVKIVECTLDGNLGTQEKWCDKGSWKYTDCMPCTDEICDNIDNDCDGDIDEDIAIIPCENECGPGDLICIDGVEECFGPEPDEEVCDYKDNDCDGQIDENQLNDCGACGPLPEDFCNGFDDDCDGNVDEDLIQECETACGSGIEVCSMGSWVGCTAKQPMDEICNGFDDNCDGQIDEGLNCLCTIDLVGVLFPCFETPLQCGGGYKSCVCEDEECTNIVMSPCYAQCYWEKPAPSNCDPLLGYVEMEMCNNHDDNCNQLVDEDLYSACYSGPPETLFVGICLPGELMCHKGEWGNNYATDAGEEVFIPDLCLDEIVPAEKDACNGADDNCDGIVDDGDEMEDTDILFVVDWSGSMTIKIEAVMTALNMFAAHYSDQDVIKWGLVIGPVILDQESAFSPVEYLQIVSPLSSFQQFMGLLSSLDPSSVNGGTEMLYDAVYLAVQNLVPAALLPWQLSQLDWVSSMQNVNSVPQLGQFLINWRDDANHVIIVFTDEEGQSYLYKDWGGTNVEYGLLQGELLQAIANAVNLYMYTFTPDPLKTKTTFLGKNVGWEPLTQFGGKWYKLTSNAAIMYESLLEILDETACGE
jgi:hypothetical protein